VNIFRTVGKGAGKLGGGVIGGSVRLAGKKLNSPWLEDVGEGVKHASTAALDNAGQFLDGAVQGTYGLIKKDGYHREQGFLHFKEAGSRTVKGLGTALKYTAQNTGTAFKGLVVGDKEQAIKGAKNLGKVAAVSMLAIGFVDLVDGADVVGAEEIETRNDHFNGQVHPETGIPFTERTIELPTGERVEGTFPVFESKFNVLLVQELYLESDHVHFQIANENLYEAVQANPSLAHELGFTKADVQSLSHGVTPDGYAWHHHEEPGVLQLVDEDVHENTGHTGGRQLWGGGALHR
jgi:hypothetical protein